MLPDREWQPTYSGLSDNYHNAIFFFDSSAQLG